MNSRIEGSVFRKKLSEFPLIILNLTPTKKVRQLSISFLLLFFHIRYILRCILMGLTYYKITKSTEKKRVVASICGNHCNFSFATSKAQNSFCKISIYCNIPKLQQVVDKNFQ